MAMWTGEQWISTGREWLFIIHTDRIESVISYWLSQISGTEEIVTSWGKRVFPQRIKTEEIAKIAARELMP